MKTIVKYLVATTLMLTFALQTIADTHTTSFSGCTSMSSLTYTQSPSSGVTWVGSGAKTWETNNSHLKITFDQSQTIGYLNASIPSTWQVTSVQIVATDQDITSVDITVNGESFTKDNLLTASGTAAPVANANVSITFTGGADKYIVVEQIIITYTSVTAAPVLNYLSSHEVGDNSATPYAYTTMPTSIQVNSDVALYIGSDPISTSNLVGIAEIWDEDLTDLHGVSTITQNSTTQFTVNIASGVLENCKTYILVIGEGINNIDQVAVTGTSKQWYFTTPTITASNLTFESGTYSFLQNATFSYADWVIKDGSTDITAQCTNFSTPSLATVGTADVTFEYKGCTITKQITVTARANYELTWENKVTNEADIVTHCQQGVAVGTLPTPTTTTISTDCGDKVFVGWTKTELANATDVAPVLVTSASIPSTNTTLYAVYANGSGIDGWQKLSAASELVVGTEYLIGTTDGSYVIGEQRDNNFGVVPATLTDGVLTPATGYNSVILGGTSGAWTLELSDNTYLCVASSTSNYLRSQSTSDVNSQWTITISTGEATITASSSSYTRNRLRYNSSSNLFAAYASGQNAVSFYKKLSSHTGYITSCSCTTPTWNESNWPTSAESGAETNFGIICNDSPGELIYTSSTPGITISGHTFVVTATGTYTINIEQPATNTYCRKTATKTLNIANLTMCSNVSFHYGNRATSQSLNDKTDICFTAAGIADEYKITNFTIPADKADFYCGWQGVDDWSGKSSMNTFTNLQMALLHDKSCSNSRGVLGSAVGAIGTLRVYSNSTQPNWYIGFIPAGYIFRWGTGTSDTWESLEMSSVNSGRTVWATDIVELDATNTAYSHHVALKTASGYVACNATSDMAMTSMGKYGTTGWSGSNVSASDAGTCGKFRAWVDQCTAANFVCHFVPHFNILYYSSDNTTLFSKSDYVAIDDNSGAKDITLLVDGPTKEGYRFIGWTKTAGGSKELNPGSSYTLWKSNDKLYPVYVEQKTLTYNGNDGVTECESEQADINTAIVVCSDGATREGYMFGGWNTAADGTGTDYAAGSNITMSTDITLFAKWLPIVYVTYDQTNITLDGGCTAKEQHKVGDVITLCATPTHVNGYTFEGWSVNGGTTQAAGSTYTIQNSDVEVNIVAVWNTPSYTFYFKNQGAGDEQTTTIDTKIGQEGSYIMAPTSCGVVPTNCEGKQFIGWLHGTYDGSDGANIEEIADLISHATGTNVEFVEPGGRITVATGGANAGNWYAVFAIPE